MKIHCLRKILRTVFVNIWVVFFSFACGESPLLKTTPQSSQEKIEECRHPLDVAIALQPSP